MTTPEEMSGKLENKIEAAEKEPVKKMRFMYKNVMNWFKKNQNNVNKRIEYYYEKSEKKSRDKMIMTYRKALISMILFDPSYDSKKIGTEDMKTISSEIISGYLEIFYGEPVNVGKNQYKLSDLAKKIWELAKES